MLNYEFRGMDINQAVLWFFIYSFCGWAMECVVIRREKGHWENRGFAKMPFCVIYGFGSFIAYHIFAPIENNYILLYIAGCVCATIFEFITGKIMLKLFGELWWNYKNKKFNYKGILCLESSLAWGLLALFIFGLFNRYVEGLVKSLNHNFVVFASTLLAVAYIIDFTYQFTKSIYTKNDEELNV